jgi:cation transport regulator ChaC
MNQTKKIKIFAYGSLMFEDSLKKTAPYATIISPVTLHGFVRVFNFPSPYRMSELDGTPCSVLNIDKSDLKHQLCGVLFEMTQESFSEMMTREEGYELVQVEVEDFHNPNTRYKAYTFRALHYDAHDYQMGSDKQHEYLDWCLQGAKKYGEDFYNNFLETTHIGEKTIAELVEEEQFILQ